MRVLRVRRCHARRAVDPGSLVINACAADLRAVLPVAPGARASRPAPVSRPRRCLERSEARLTLHHLHHHHRAHHGADHPAGGLSAHGVRCHAKKHGLKWPEVQASVHSSKRSRSQAPCRMRPTPAEIPDRARDRVPRVPQVPCVPRVPQCHGAAGGTCAAGATCATCATAPRCRACHGAVCGCYCSLSSKSWKIMSSNLGGGARRPVPAPVTRRCARDLPVLPARGHRTRLAG